MDRWRGPIYADAVGLDLLETHAVTGERTGYAESVRRALAALDASAVPYAVIGAAALAARGLPRMTADLDVLVYREDAFAALDALGRAGFDSVAPVRRNDEPESMYVLVGGGGHEVDLLVAEAEPEATVVAEAPPADLFGHRAPTATLEHLLLMYLYSNQPRHLGDFARIVCEGKPDLPSVERYLADVHPEMLPELQRRVRKAREPEPAPPRPPRRKRGRLR